MMTYEEAINYIHTVSWTGSRPGLSRITELCGMLGDPQDSLRFIHVAGTNGKGSVSSMLSSVLTEAGMKVGVFTSPYVYRFNERIAIGKEPISDGDLAKTVEKVKTYADKMADPPTEFELITAVGFEYFKDLKCDVVVLEAGMGGRLDSTNVIKSSLLSIITGIDLDHTAILGDTCEKIAAEKAGIIKEGCPVLIGKCKATYPADGGLNSSEKVVFNAAESKNAPFEKTDYSRLSDIKLSLTGASFRFSGYKDPFKIALAGSYQPENAALVITACEKLCINERYIHEGLKRASWRGRFERLSSDPTVIFDGGHNPQGVSAAVRTVKEVFPVKINVVTGVMADKAYTQMAEMISTVAKKVYCVTPDNPRALPAEKLTQVYLDCGIEAEPFKTVEAAVRAALSDGDTLGLGSLYMYKEFFDAVIKVKKDRS